MRAVVFRTRAVWDVEELADAVARFAGSRTSGERFIAELRSKCEAHARQPTMGDPRDDLAPGLRGFVFRKKYVAIYRPLPDGIVVLRVFLATRDYGRFFHQ